MTATLHVGNIHMVRTIPKSPTGLYWNMRGHVRCEIHIQEIEPDRWEADGWEAIPEKESPHTRHYQCQRCSPDGNAIGR